MENFVISIEAVIPMFTMLLLGIWVRKQGLLNDEEIAKLNSVIFKVLFPILMFSNI